MSSANQSIPVLVAGALGRMGSEVIKAINSSKDYQLVGAIDNQKEKEGQDIGSLIGLGPLDGAKDGGRITKSGVKRRTKKFAKKKKQANKMRKK